MGQQGLAAGWSTWQDQYLEAARQKRMLAAAGARLQRPALVASFASWRSSWDEAEKERARTEAAAQKTQLLASSRAHRSELEAEIEKLKAEHAAALEAAAREREELVSRLSADARGAEEELQKQAALQLEAEKEKRVAHLQQMAARRMGQQGLAMGWTAWQEQYLDAARQKRMLAAAGARLMRPALTASFVSWRFDWQEAQKELVAEGQKLLQSTQARKEADLQLQVQSLQKEIAALREAASAEKDVLTAEMELDKARAEAAYHK